MLGQAETEAGSLHPVLACSASVISELVLSTRAFFDMLAVEQHVDMMHALVQGPQAHQAGVVFPKEQSALDRTLLVGNLNPSVSDEQVCPHPDLSCSQVSQCSHGEPTGGALAWSFHLIMVGFRLAGD